MLNTSLLKLQGFQIIRNGLSEQEIYTGQKLAEGPDANYPEVIEYVRTVFLPKIHPQMKFQKLRLSNSNNSTDAGSFHRDVVPIRHESADIVEDGIFTCLSYFDDSTLQIIPGSHTKYQIPLGEAIDMFFNGVKEIQMAPGDLLVFHPTLLHKGIFSNIKSPHRRLLQVFECSIHDRPERDIIHLPGRSIGKAGLMKWIAKYPFLSAIPNFQGYLNAASGYNNKKLGEIIDLDVKYISSEGLCTRTDGTGVDSLNKYYLSVREPFDVYEDNKDEVKYIMFTRQQLLHSVVFICFAMVLILTIVSLIKSVKNHM